MENAFKPSWNTYPQVIPAFSNKNRVLNLENAVLATVKLIPECFFLCTNEPTQSSVRFL